MTKQQNGLQVVFANDFLKFVFFNILSITNRRSFTRKINSLPFINNTLGNVQKVFVKDKPQQIIIYTTFHGTFCHIEGFKFGLTDLLTGSKAHVRTIETILREKTIEELEHWY